MRQGDILRVLISLTAEELAAARGRPVPAGEWVQWSEATAIDEEGVGVDSLDRLSLVGRVNEFFHLHEVGSEDYLVIRRTLGEWVEVVAQTLALRSERLTFRTSGSTGEPKPVTLDRRWLQQELEALDALLPRGGRLLCLVPPHHIYGWLLGVGLPALRHAEVIDLRAAAPSRAAAVAVAGDVVVATPFLWEQIRAMGAVPAGAWGVSAGAPMPEALWRALRAGGLCGLLELYGSSETAGVGWRMEPDAPFTLFEHWRVLEEGVLERCGADAEPVAAPDHLVFEQPRRFRVAGRRDGAVQVGGVNVFPERVTAVLAAHPEVAEAAVRLDGEGAGARLKAFVVLAPGAEEARVAEELEALCRERLKAPERPARYSFGAEAPRNAMGKPADWEA